MLNDSLVQRLVLFLPFAKSILILKHHFLLLAKDLFDYLVLVLAHLVESIACLHSQLVVLFTDALHSPAVVLSQRIRLLLPCIANLPQMVLLLVMDLP